MTIRRVQLYGQRCSGTNFLHKLIEQNIEDLPVGFPFGFKHSAPRFLDRHHEDCLFCVIYRNPFDWIRSVHATPWHAAPSLQGLTLDEFMQRPWHCIWDQASDTPPDDPKFRTEMMHERHPESGARYANILKMRSDRIARWHRLRSTVTHHWWVQYESLIRYPERLIADLARAAGRVLRTPFRPVLHYKGSPDAGKFSPKTYPPLTQPQSAILFNQLDWQIEKQLGYFPPCGSTARGLRG